MLGRFPPTCLGKLGGLVEIRQEGEVLREVGLDRLDAVVREIFDPRRREVVLDPVQDAAHATMIVSPPDGCMSRSAHFFGEYSPASTHLAPFLLINPRSGDGGADE